MIRQRGDSANRDERSLTLIDEPFVTVGPNGQRQSFQLVIHSPQPAREKDPWSWTCVILLKPLYRSEIPCRGLSPFHALADAVARATDYLSHVTASGGKILAPSGREVGVPSLKLHAPTEGDGG
ncbi:MAG TPA: hypothetical protein VFJ68_09845 [Casimicrobiaceae bacterium]|nr:hypothetical protein [Casimicrobiaceae bacterium]